MKQLNKMSALLMLCVLFTQFSFAQNQPTINSRLSGRVLDAANKEPLPGAVVRIKGVTNSTGTDSEGRFNLVTDQAFPYTIVVSYIGYNPQEVLVTGSPVDILLVGNASQLSDVVITGYSSQERKYIAGSITSVSGSVIQDMPEAGFNQALQGNAPGVQVLANSGVPGGSITLRIRGSNSINASVDPLYVIDGVFVANTDLIQTGLGSQEQSNPLSDLDPNDIENIQILKDANATAIYGSLGANGVVIVTTKRGKRNTDAQINFSTYQGYSTAIKKFQVTTGPQTETLVNEAAANTAADNGTTAVLPFANPAAAPTYDRIDDIFRTAISQNYEVSATGGGANSTYYVGFGYLDQPSIVKPSGYKRYSGRFNYDSYLTNKLKVGTSLSISRSWRNLSSNDNNPQGVINSALFTRSYLPIYNADGTYARYGSFDNAEALIANLNNISVEWHTIGNVYGEYSFLPELKLRSSVSMDNATNNENDYTNTLLAAGIATNGSAAAYNVSNIVLTNEQVLTYIKSFGSGKKHNINALIGNTISTTQSQNISASGTGFATNSLQAISVAATKSGSSSQSFSKLLSFFAKAGYAYDDKYIIDASLRADGSSKFGVNKRWGYFPSIGVAWRASQEDFIKKLDVFSDLKLRASLGWSGNQNGIGAYAAQGLWSSGANYLDQPGTAPSQLANPNLTWETTRQVDFGTEFGVLKGRLNFDVDYYNKYTYNLLLNVPVPYRSGFATYLENYGAVTNKGVEAAIRSVNIQNGDFKWTTSFNIAFNRNRIDKLASDITQGASGRNISILRQGYPINSFYLYKQLEVDPKTGNAVYDDVNHDGKITTADREIVGNAMPNYTGGLTNTISYKRFDLNFFFYFQQGNKIMNMNDFFLIHGGTQANIGFVPRQLDRWTTVGQITDIPRLTTATANPDQNDGPANNYGGNVASLSSRYLEDGSFIRLKTLSLGYNLPSELLKKAGISKLRIYVEGTNLLTFTKYQGLDPEVSSQSSSQNTAGYDWATVPQPRTIQVGAHLTL